MHTLLKNRLKKTKLNIEIVTNKYKSTFSNDMVKEEIKYTKLSGNATKKTNEI